MSTKQAGPRLGRGLAAILGEAALTPDAPGGIRQTPIDLLEPSPFQPRRAMNDEALQELAESIRARGILQPLLIRPHPQVLGRFQIVAGERRWRAAGLAGLHEVPALVRELSDSEAMASALVENLQRQDLNPIEEAEGYSRLLDEFGMTHETLAQAVGKSRSHLTNTLRLLNLPDRVKQAVRGGEISAGHARALLGVVDPEAGMAAVLEQGLSVRQTEALADKKQADREREPSVKDPDMAALEHELSEELGMRVEIAARGQAGAVRIHYRNLDQLDAFLARLRGVPAAPSF
jgi:ParB family transcriptional regulator, chromosome partitioning protein